ncbi:MAG: hypothetical protein AAFW75_10865 [Cyanobacteria bacterium J06636_16]
MKSAINSKLRRSRLLPFQSRYPLRLLAPVIPFIPRQVSYLEDLLGDS